MRREPLQLDGFTIACMSSLQPALLPGIEFNALISLIALIIWTFFLSYQKNCYAGGGRHHVDASTWCYLKDRTCKWCTCCPSLLCSRISCTQHRCADGIFIIRKYLCQFILITFFIIQLSAPLDFVTGVIDSLYIGEEDTAISAVELIGYKLKAKILHLCIPFINLISSITDGERLR